MENGGQPRRCLGRLGKFRKVDQGIWERSCLRYSLSYLPSGCLVVDDIDTQLGLAQPVRLVCLIIMIMNLASNRLPVRRLL